MKVLKYTLFLSIVIWSCNFSDSSSAASDSTKANPSDLSESQPTGSRSSDIEIDEVFNGEELKLLKMISKDYQEINCQGYVQDRTAADCFEFSSISYKNNFLQRIPIGTDFPYNNKLRVSKYESESALPSLWSSKCGYADEKGGMILNYYCINTNGPIWNYLTKLGQENALIASFVEDYTKANDFTPGTQERILLSSTDELDFQNEDHRLFWTIYHISLNEVMNSSKELKRIKSDSK